MLKSFQASQTSSKSCEGEFGEILYKKRRDYKYTLYQAVICETCIKGFSGKNEFLSINEAGRLNIKTGYGWDGASGPAIDTKTIMRASLVHDALYQLIREGVLPQHRKGAADEVFYRICKEDGMCPIRAWCVFKAVQWFGGFATRSDVIAAP